MNSVDSTKGIGAVLIIEIIGRPKEHLVKSLEEIIKQIGEEKRVAIKDKKINAPVLMKDQKDFYTSFAEIDVEVETILDLAILIFRYMPANIEIVYPEIIAIQNNDWNDILNELTRRLHGYDEIARVIQNEKIILERKLREVLGEKGLEKVKPKRKKQNKITKTNKIKRKKKEQ